jgi:hypothetical protein
MGASPGTGRDVCVGGEGAVEDEILKLHPLATYVGRSAGSTF